MTATPTVTVAMAVYNAAPFLRQAIDSIINQSFTDWELIIINDGSTDHSSEIIAGYEDKRIFVIQNTQNQGLCACRLQTIAIARGKYLCFQDADDRCSPHRLEILIKRFEAEDTLDVCGTAAWIIHEADNKKIHKKPAENVKLKTAILFGFPFISPSLCFRTEKIRQAANLMPSNIKQAEDYVLLALLWRQGGQMANLAEPLYYYRVHSGADRITREENNADIVAGRFAAQRILFSVWNLSPTDEILVLHDQLTYYPQRIKQLSVAVAAAYCQWWVQVCQANVKINHVSQTHLVQAVSNAVYRLLLQKALPFRAAARLWWQYGKLLRPSFRAKWLIKRCIS